MSLVGGNIEVVVDSLPESSFVEMVHTEGMPGKLSKPIETYDSMALSGVPHNLDFNKLESSEYSKNLEMLNRQKTERRDGSKVNKSSLTNLQSYFQTRGINNNTNMTNQSVNLNNVQVDSPILVDPQLRTQAVAPFVPPLRTPIPTEQLLA